MLCILFPSHQIITVEGINKRWTTRAPVPQKSARSLSLITHRNESGDASSHLHGRFTD